MQQRNGSAQSLDGTQKQFLRSRYGGLVDEVGVVYGSSMMDKSCASGYCTSTDSAAQTYCDRIYVKDPYKQDDVDQLMLLAHEMRHSEQCRQLGGEGKFGFHYFREFKRANQTYETNSMEEDARNSASALSSNLPGHSSQGSPSQVSSVSTQTNWGAGAREASRYCTSNGFGSGFPDGEEGIENGRRVIGVNCSKNTQRFTVPSNISLQ